MTRISTPEAVPYLLLGDTRLRRLQDRVRGLLESWYGTWAPDNAAHPHTELSPDGPPSETAVRGECWTFTASRAQDDVLLQATVPADFLRLLSGASSATSVLTSGTDCARGALAVAATGKIVGALCTEIAHAALPRTPISMQRLSHATDIPSLRRRPGVRALLVSVGIDRPRVVLELLLTAPIIDALLAERPPIAGHEPLIARRKASAEQPVAVSAVLGNATVNWRDLLALCIGDVIVLEQSLSSRCTLHVGGATPIAEAQIGQVDNTLAAQVTRVGTTF